jgi:hypothetical protein
VAENERLPYSGHVTSISYHIRSREPIIYHILVTWSHQLPYSGHVTPSATIFWSRDPISYHILVTWPHQLPYSGHVSQSTVSVYSDEAVVRDSPERRLVAVLEHVEWCSLQFHQILVCSSVRFRWRQARDDLDTVSWSIDDIYVGEGCPQQCNGRGQCMDGSCRCDLGYVGKYWNRKITWIYKELQ